ncbi:MAG: HD domain-containing protein [Roseburia hominis]
MKRIPTTDLKPGMFTARPVRTAAGQIILDEGCLLSAQTILHIRDYSIPEVWIRDSSDSSGGLHDYLQKQYAPVRSRSERIRQSEEYKIFSQKFDSCTTMLHTALNDCILRAKKLETDKLLAGTLDLFASHTTTLSMFDMLHNLRQIDDSTYAHSVNVAIISRMLGNWLGFSEDAQNTLTLCGLLHDIGKSRIPASIIGKPGRLTSEEFEQIKRHPLLGYELLKNQPLDPHIKNAATDASRAV